LATQDHSGEWVDDPSPPKPIKLTSTLKKGKASPTDDCTVALWLPSNIPTRLRSGSCVDGLATKEIILRVADCSDSLHNIRRCLRELSTFSSYKSKNVDGQRTQTRALGTLKALRDKRDRYAARYRHSRVAWLVLDPDQAFEGGKWKKVLRTLKPADLTFPGNEEEDSVLDSDDASRDQGADGMVHGVGSNAKKRRGEGYRYVSWIWRVEGQDARDIPGLDSSASEEDVYKCEMFY
jgi:hypothetical protein